MTRLKVPISKKPIWRAALRGGAILAILALAAVLLAAGPIASPAPQPGAKPDGPQVSISNFQFAPATLSIPAGARVTWTNRDEDTHTVTASNRLFSSQGLDPGQSFTYTFTTPGTYTYYCAIHPHMTGSVIVK